jgi:tetratricopeptide (TPR) repeat protein
MQRLHMRIVLSLLTCCLLWVSPAGAWEKRAQQSIAAMAMQVLKAEYPDTFRTQDANYEADVLRGAADGYALLQAQTPMPTLEAAVQTVGAQIPLLRDARRYGVGSYFAYRMGVLSSLVADIQFPLGFPQSPVEQQVAKKAFWDIERNLDGYSFSPSKKKIDLVRDVNEYFAKNQMFAREDAKIIVEDYVRGKGYDGFLKQGGPVYFSRAVEAVADVWHTVLIPQKLDFLQPPSRAALAWYFVDEIEYLLNVKRNYLHAMKVYEHFAEVDPGLPEAYERIGDMLYAYNTPESKARGVQEWIKAHQAGAANRTRVSKKLAKHFMEEGNDYLAKAGQPGSEETDLPNALHAFEQALAYDRTNEEAATYIQKTHVAIQERKERYENTVKLIATAEKVTNEAEKSRLAGDYSNAIKTYRQAITFYEAVGDEFRDQKKTAEEGKRRLRKVIADVINEVLDKANEVIDKGDRAKEENRFEDAIAEYSKVEGIVSVIPEDESPTLTQEKQDMIARAQKKVDEAKTAKVRYEAAKAEQEAAARRGGGGGQVPRPAAVGGGQPAGGAQGQGTGR